MNLFRVFQIQDERDEMKHMLVTALIRSPELLASYRDDMSKLEGIASRSPLADALSGNRNSRRLELLQEVIETANFGIKMKL